MKKRERSAERKAHYEANKPKVLAQSKVYNEANKSRRASNGKAYYQANKARLRAIYIEKTYGVPVSEQGKLPVECEICGADGLAHAKGLSIDHDHETGKFRGVLCGNCNRALGMMADRPERLRAAAEYLESRRQSA